MAGPGKVLLQAAQVEGAHVLPLVDKLLTSRGAVDKALLAACGFHPTGVCCRGASLGTHT